MGEVVQLFKGAENAMDDIESRRQAYYEQEAINKVMSNYELLKEKVRAFMLAKMRKYGWKNTDVTISCYITIAEFELNKRATFNGVMKLIVDYVFERSVQLGKREWAIFFLYKKLGQEKVGK
jgi:hypothetical protein